MEKVSFKNPYMPLLVKLLKMEKPNLNFRCTDGCSNRLYIPEVGPFHLSAPQTAAGGNQTEGSNTIMLTSFALKFWSNKIIDVDIILSITLTVS